MGYTGMCHSTGYGFCLSESGTGPKNQCSCLEQGLLFAIPTLGHGQGDYFAAIIALQKNFVAVCRSCPAFFSLEQGIYCPEQGSKIVSL